MKKPFLSPIKAAKDPGIVIETKIGFLVAESFKDFSFEAESRKLDKASEFDSSEEAQEVIDEIQAWAKSLKVKVRI